jgi:predicted ATPase/DNA-binding CsgD family transcriptional regulator
VPGGHRADDQPDRLLLPYERVYVVPGLSVIGGGGDAVDLFAARVAAATGDPAPPDPVRVAALCRALDGMALAIELAAARFAALGLDGLESGLDQRLRLLTTGPHAADRHGSLRAAIGWSYELLSSADRRLLRGVAVFASWFDVDAARAVAGADREHAEIADGLARLAEHSLLVVERGERTRYRALETIRQYGVERLDEAGELDQIRAGHEQWCRRSLAALRQTEAAETGDAWCARLDRIADDVGAALAWSAGVASRRAQAAELAAELAGPLFLRGRQAQAQQRYEQGAELAATPLERAACLRLAAGAAASRFVGDDALRLLRMAAGAALAAGDRAGAARQATPWRDARFPDHCGDEQTRRVGTPGTAVTARESEVVALLCKHLTNAQIAEALFISERTVESHVTALLRKFEVPDRRSLARLVAAAGGAPVRGGLPVPVTAFLGRVAERAALLATLAGHRLVTAVGPGGVPVGPTAMKSRSPQLFLTGDAAFWPGQPLLISAIGPTCGGRPPGTGCPAAGAPTAGIAVTTVAASTAPRVIKPGRARRGFLRWPTNRSPASGVGMAPRFVAEGQLIGLPPSRGGYCPVSIEPHGA